MTTQHRLTLLLIPLLLLFLAGCASGYISEELPVDDTVIERTLQFLENGGQDRGPVYNFTMEVPENWVGDFETNTQANRLSFEYRVNERSTVPIFYIEALSPVQYWEQIGSYPGAFVNIANEIDTYFVYSFPVNPSTSLLNEAQFNALAEQVPSIVASFEATSTMNNMYEAAF